MATWPASLPGGSSASVRKCYGEWWVGVVYLFALERYSGARAGLCLECGFSSVGRACISGFLSPPFFDLVRQRFGLRSHLPTLMRVWGLCGVVAWAPLSCMPLVEFSGAVLPTGDSASGLFASCFQDFGSSSAGLRQACLS